MGECEWDNVIIIIIMMTKVFSSADNGHLFLGGRKWWRSLGCCLDNETFIEVFSSFESTWKILLLVYSLVIPRSTRTTVAIS